MHGIRYGGRRLVSDAIHFYHDGRLSVKRGKIICFFKPVRDNSDIFKQDFGTLVRCDDGNFGKFVSEIPAFIHTDQDIAAGCFNGAGRQLNGRPANCLGNVVKG